MQAKFWGVRGSIATAIEKDAVRRKLERALTAATPADIIDPQNIGSFIDSMPFSVKGTIGGNTTCVELRSSKNELIIIDGGTGLARLGQTLMTDAAFRNGTTIHMFLTHTHWDHIQGIMFFGPFFVPGNTVHFYSSVEDLHDRLRYQTPPTHFPITFDDLPVKKEFHYFEPGELFNLSNMTVTSKAIRHPGTAYSYKFIENATRKSFVFCSDAEFNLEVMDDIVQYIEYFRDSDILVFDTQYTFEESLQKIDWGHSSAAIATDIAIKSNVKKLLLFHHDPSYDDEKMDAVILQAMKYKEMVAPHNHLEIETAYEGLVLDL